MYHSVVPARAGVIPESCMWFLLPRSGSRASGGDPLHIYYPIFLRKITDGVMKRCHRNAFTYLYFLLLCSCRLSAHYRTRGGEWWGRNSGDPAYLYVVDRP